jgi:thiamine biosynthesis lipoprotein
MHELRRARPLLGTLVEIQARAPFALPRLHAAIDAAFAVIAQVHALMSAHEPASDVGRLNRLLPGAAPLSIDPHTVAVLRAAQQFSAAARAPSISRWRRAWSAGVT